MTLFRPVNQIELDLIAQSDWLTFPPRLPEQPIFYPVTNLLYARKITTEWNVPAYGVGHVVVFEVKDSFLAKYEVQNVGGENIDEYWIPAEDLATMNQNILGKIQLLETYTT